MTTVFALIALAAFLMLARVFPGVYRDHKRDLEPRGVLVYVITIDLSGIYAGLQATTLSLEEAAASMNRFGEAFNE